MCLICLLLFDLPVWYSSFSWICIRQTLSFSNRISIRAAVLNLIADNIACFIWIHLFLVSYARTSCIEQLPYHFIIDIPYPTWKCDQSWSLFKMQKAPHSFSCEALGCFVRGTDREQMDDWWCEKAWFCRDAGKTEVQQTLISLAMCLSAPRSYGFRGCCFRQISTAGVHCRTRSVFDLAVFQRKFKKSKISYCNFRAAIV